MEHQDKRNLELVTNAIEIKGYEVREEEIEDKKYLVVPVTMIVEGVLNNLLFPRMELAKSVPGWNGRPLMHNHPKQGTANVPSLWGTDRLGYVFNTHLDELESGVAVLKAEAWFDDAKLKQRDNSLYTKIKTGAIVEVSTGLFLEAEPVSAMYKNKAFNAIAKEYVPDHLAILTDTKGACSIEDGCGIRQNSDSSENIENVEYNKTTNTTELVMAENKCNCPDKVNILINSGMFVEEDREDLLVMNASEIDKLIEESKELEVENNTEVETSVVKEVPKEKDDDAPEALPKAAVANEKITMANFENSDLVDSLFKNEVKAALSLFNNAKQSFINKIKSNPRNKLADAVLNAMDFDALSAIAELAEASVETKAVVQNVAQVTPDYAVAGIAVNADNKKNLPVFGSNVKTYKKGN